MAERLIVVDKDRLEYHGLFDMRELFRVMQQWASDKGYWLIEKHHGESVKPEGKTVDMDFEPFRKFSDYAKSIVKVKVQFSDVRDVVVEREGRKVKLQEGRAFFIFDGILETDYEHRWESKPVFYVIRTIFEKYVYTPFMSGFERLVRDDTLMLKNNLKAFLNLEKFH